MEIRPIRRINLRFLCAFAAVGMLSRQVPFFVGPTSLRRDMTIPSPSQHDINSLKEEATRKPTMVIHVGPSKVCFFVSETIEMTTPQPEQLIVFLRNLRYTSD